MSRMRSKGLTLITSLRSRTGSSKGGIAQVIPLAPPRDSCGLSKEIVA